MKILDSVVHLAKNQRRLESLDLSSSPRTIARPSIEEPPQLELKQLPSHLKYAYLGADSTLPVIVAQSLNQEQEEKLLRVLREHKRAIGWTLADIKGISPSFCMHKILLEEGSKSNIEH